MVDVVDRPTRSRMMGRIRGRNTRPEVVLRSALHRLGLRFRIHDRSLPGRPDIVLRRHGAVVQVHGCFWHRHEGCRFTTTPASNRAFWDEKFRANVLRDEQAEASLLEQGWRIAVVWECAVRDFGAEAIAADLAAWLQRGEDRLDIPASASQTHQSKHKEGDS